MHQLIFTIQNQITEQEKQQQKKRLEGICSYSVVAIGYWFDSASECHQCFQKRELSILIATVHPTLQWKKNNQTKKKEIARRKHFEQINETQRDELDGSVQRENRHTDQPRVERDL